RVAGNRKLYLKLLRQFTEQQGPAVTQISAALDQGDRGLAERLAHTLKGVAGNIGAKEIQVAAGTLEKFIREKAALSEIQTAKGQVAATLDPLLKQLWTALSSNQPATPVANSPPLAHVDPAHSRDVAARLTKLLSDFDPGAVEFLEANHAALR